jgi:hypothetical protein
VCLCLEDEALQRLAVPPMVVDNRSRHGRPSPCRSRPARAFPPVSAPPIA